MAKMLKCKSNEGGTSEKKRKKEIKKTRTASETADVQTISYTLVTFHPF